MRLLLALLYVVLVAGILSAVGSPKAMAGSPYVSSPGPASTDVRAPVAPQPGTHAEARVYEQRETESPEVQEFAGGDVVIGVSVLVLVLIVVVLVLLLSD